MAPYRPPVRAIDIFQDHDFGEYLRQPTSLDISSYSNVKPGQELSGALLGDFPAELRLKILLMACGDRLRPYHDRDDRNYGECAYRQLLVTCKTFHNELRIEVLRNAQVLFLGIYSLEWFTQDTLNYSNVFKIHACRIALEVDEFDVAELISSPGMCNRDQLRKRQVFKGKGRYRDMFWRRLACLELEEVSLYVAETCEAHDLAALGKRLPKALARFNFKPSSLRQVKVYCRKSQQYTTYPGEKPWIIPLNDPPHSRVPLSAITNNGRNHGTLGTREWEHIVLYDAA